MNLQASARRDPSVRPAHAAAKLREKGSTCAARASPDLPESRTVRGLLESAHGQSPRQPKRGQRGLPRRLPDPRPRGPAGARPAICYQPGPAAYQPLAALLSLAESPAIASRPPKIIGRGPRYLTRPLILGRPTSADLDRWWPRLSLLLQGRALAGPLAPSGPDLAPARRAASGRSARRGPCPDGAWFTGRSKIFVWVPDRPRRAPFAEHRGANTRPPHRLHEPPGEPEGPDMPTIGPSGRHGHPPPPDAPGAGPRLPDTADRRGGGSPCVRVWRI